MVVMTAVALVLSPLRLYRYHHGMVAGFLLPFLLTGNALADLATQCNRSNIGSACVLPCNYREIECYAPGFGNVLPPGTACDVPSGKTGRCDASARCCDMSSLSPITGVCFDPIHYRSCNYPGASCNSSCRKPQEVPEMSDYAAMAFVAFSSFMIWRLCRRHPMSG